MLTTRRRLVHVKTRYKARFKSALPLYLTHCYMYSGQYTRHLSTIFPELNLCKNINFSNNLLQSNLSDPRAEVEVAAGRTGDI